MADSPPVRRSMGVILFTLLLIAALTVLFLIGTELIGAVTPPSPSAIAIR